MVVVAIKEQRQCRTFEAKMRVHLHAHVEALGVLLVIDVIKEVCLDFRRINVTLDASDNFHRNVVIVL